jgi:single-stranded-DNA-specific exonuclease
VAPEANIRSYVPHRLEEGYGLNAEALRTLAEEGTNLVITVDCGVTAVEEAKVAAEAGMDLVITDHHNVLQEDGEAVLPEAVAIVHPGLPGSAYPNQELCGAGVAFKLACRFAKTWCGSERVSEALQWTLTDALALVALGTIADVMPLTGENRVLSHLGLRRLRGTRMPGLGALMEVTGLDSADMDSDAIGFRLAPCINAAGRMGHARDAVELLTAATGARAEEIAKQLHTLNNQRRATEQEILAQAIEMAEASGMTRPDRRIIVLSHPDWHPGVVGIVCSRLVDRYGRPAILMQEDGGTCRGSARSIPGYSIHDGLVECREYLERYGGHDAAAGLSLSTDNLTSFTAAITRHANAAIEQEDLVPWLVIDADAALDEIVEEEVRELEKMSPFGRGNARPRMRLLDLKITEVKPMGRDKRHLSLRLASGEGEHGRSVRAVWWKPMEQVANRLAVGMRVDIVARASLNTWNNRTSAELEILDLDDHSGRSAWEQS